MDMETGPFDAISTFWVNTNYYCIDEIFKCWRRICRVMKISDQVMVCLREIARDPDFKPNTFDDVFKVWANKGLKRFDQIYGDHEMVTFENIEKKYVLSGKLFLKYLQISSYLKDESKIKTLEDMI